MKSISAQILTRLSVCAVMIMGLRLSAAASCGDTMAAIASAKPIVTPLMAPPLVTPSQLDSKNATIVGLWYVQLVVGGQAIQEAFQNWNAGGTEVHNPNLDPRSGTVCLGAWTRTSDGAYKLIHRGWNYDTTGDYLGTFHLTEIVHVKQNGTVQTGLFKVDFYDPSGNFLSEIDGNIVGQRIQSE